MNLITTWQGVEKNVNCFPNCKFYFIYYNMIFTLQSVYISVTNVYYILNTQVYVHADVITHLLVQIYNHQARG